MLRLITAIGLVSLCAAQNPAPSDAAQIRREISELRQRLESLESRLPADMPATASDLDAAPVRSAPEETVPPPKAPAEPFAFADFTWLNGNSRTHEPPLDTK